MSASLYSAFQALLHRPGPPTTSAVERGAVARFAEAVGDPIVLDADDQPQVPPTFLASIPYRRAPLPGGADGHLINVENSFTFVRAPTVGESITTVAWFRGVAERGPWLRLDLEVHYTDARGALVASVQVQFVVDFEGLCAAALSDTRRGKTAPVFVEPPFIPHGVARPRSERGLGPAWETLDLLAKRPGDSLPPLAKPPLTTLQFVQYAGASGDFNPLHYDRRFAEQCGFPDVVAPGLLKMAFFAQHMTLCAGRVGALRRLVAKYRGFDVPGQALTSCGVIRDVSHADGKRALEIDLSLADQSGEATTIGSATIEVAART